MALFASPALLWGLVLAALPLLIHLLNRRKHRETSWAAMQFLLEAVRKNSRRLRIEQLILLAVRTLILVLIVLAMARPHLQELGIYFTADVPVHKILVVDTSFSMLYEPAGRSRLQQAKGIARQIAEESKQGDALNLVRMSAAEPRVIVAQPAFRPSEVVEEIDALPLQHVRGDVHATLVEVRNLLQAAPEIPNKEVYLISDFQRNGWIPDSAGRPAEIRNLLREIGEKAQIVLLDLSQGTAQNSAITDFRSLDSYLATGLTARFRVALTTFGPATLPNQKLEFFVDGRLREERTVDLQPATETVEFFSHTFSSAGPHRLEVRLQKDLLELDDSARLAVTVKDQIKVLCVNGKLAGDPRETATYHLQIALAPRTRETAAPSLMRPRVIPFGELRGMDLAGFDCVFLCDVSSFDAGEAQILESYLKGGGSVIWTLGARVQPENYNRILFRDGQGIFPARLGARRGDAEKREQPILFDASRLAHPIVNVFQGADHAGLNTTRTYEYYETRLPENGRARTVLSFENGDPAIVEMPVESGKVLLVTTTVDESWSNWAIWPSFVPMIHEMVSYAISGAGADLRVGMPLARVVQTRGADPVATVLRPDNRSDPVQVTTKGSVSEFTYEATNLSGFYELQFGPPLSRSESFAFNVDPRESNLARLEQDEIDRELLPGTQYVYQTEWEEIERQASGPVRQRGGLTRWFLYAALYLLFVEQMMAWNFLYGLWMLFPPLLLVSWFWRRA